MPRYTITTTFLKDGEIQVRTGKREGANLDWTLLYYYNKARKFYHENLIGFSCVEYKPPPIVRQPRKSRKDKEGPDWSKRFEE